MARGKIVDVGTSFAARRLAARAFRRADRWSLAALGLVLAVGIGSSLAFLNAAVRTNSAYDDYVHAADVSEVVINPSTSTSGIDQAIRSFPGVRAVHTDSLLLAIVQPAGTSLEEAANSPEATDASAFYQVRGSTDGRYIENDRPVVDAGRLATGRHEVFISHESVPTIERLSGAPVRIGTRITIGFASQTEFGDDGIPVPIGVEDVTVVGIGRLPDEVLPDGLYPRERLLVSPDVARKYECPPSPVEFGMSLDQLLRALRPQNCSTSYRYYSLSLNNGLAGVRRVIGEFDHAARRLGPQLTPIDDRGAGYYLIASDRAIDARRVERATQPTVTSLGIFGVAGAVATMVLSALLLVRLVRRHDSTLQVERDGCDPPGPCRHPHHGAPARDGGRPRPRRGARVRHVSARPGRCRPVARPEPGDAPGHGCDGAGRRVHSVVRAPRRRDRDVAESGPKGVDGQVPTPRPLVDPDQPSRTGRRCRGGARSLRPDELRGDGHRMRRRGDHVGHRDRVRGEPHPPGHPPGRVRVAVVRSGDHRLGLRRSRHRPGRRGPERSRRRSRAWAPLAMDSGALVDGKPVPTVFVGAGYDRIAPPVVEGRAPLTSREVALGRTTASELGVSIGDEVDLSSPLLAERRRATVVGTMIASPFGQFAADRGGLGVGAIVPAADDFSSRSYSVVVIQLERGNDGGPLLRQLGHRLTAWDANGVPPVTLSRPVRPPEIVDANGLRRLPLLLGLTIGLSMMLGLSLLVLVSVRDRGRELGVLRVLGFTGRQVRRSVRWQTLTCVALALVVGLPAGWIVGRWTWIRFAQRLGARSNVAFPTGWIGLTAVATFGLALLAAAVPARRASRWPTRSGRADVGRPPR